jgi:ketosteroid isomerase-like protein
MTTSNLDIIDRFFAAYSKRDMDGLKLVLDEHAKWISLGQHPFGGVKNGFQEVIAFFDAMGAIMGKSNVRVEKLIVSENDQHVVECQHVWTNRDDGHNLDHLVCVLWTFENSKIVEGRHFFADPKAADDFFKYIASING